MPYGFCCYAFSAVVQWGRMRNPQQDWTVVELRMEGIGLMLELSVIVPVYNMAKDGNLDYCMSSLVRQTLQSMEIIAVDDASTDDSLKILREFEKKYPGRVRVVASPENRRQGGARNLGLREAQGRYIGFMDADDWAVETLYERMVELAKRTGADAVGTDMCRVYEHTMIPTQREECNLPSQTGVFDHERRKKYLLQPGPVVTKIYAREIFFDREFRFPEYMAYEDNAVFLELGMRIKRFEHIPEANIFYYQHSDSTTHSVDMKKCQERMEAMRIMLRSAEKNGAMEEYRDVVEFWFSTLFYRNTLFSCMQSKLRKKRKFVKRLGEEMAATFPKFRENAYYLQAVNAYEQELINLQLKSTTVFMFVYRLKMISRRIRRTCCVWLQML